MTLTIHLPQDVEEQLRKSPGFDFDHHAQRVVIVQLYRDGRISRIQLEQLLAMSRFDSDDVIKSLGGFDEFSIDEIDRQAVEALAASKASGR